MSKQSVFGKQDPRDRVLLVLIYLDLRIHARKTQKCSVVYSLFDASVFFAVYFFEARFSLFVAPDPLSEFSFDDLLFFQRQHRFRLVQHIPDSRIVGKIVLDVFYRHGFHIERPLDYVKRFHPVCSVFRI